MARKNVEFVDTLKLLATAIQVFDENKQTVLKEATDGAVTSKIRALQILDEGIEPDEKLLERARELRQSILQKRMVDELKAIRPNDFFMNIYTNVVADTAPKYSIGLLVWAPKLMADNIKREEADADLQATGANSQYIGTIGSKLSVKYIPIRSFYLRSYEKWTNLGQDNEGNLIAFWSNNEFSKETMLQGRVKKHEVSRFAANSRVTQMNYVKEI